jgi:two-component system sensor histidine kinase PilS (NtrC family)
LRESEELVRQRELDIANLAELNEFIVRHLRESILVVDAQDRIRLINDSAARLLRGGDARPGMLLGEASPRLLYLLHTWRRQSPEWHVQTLSLVGMGGAALLQPHFVALEGTNAGPTLIFLEDTSALAERVQQSKLAALGRLSASIAHEIRNPVGAMSHAAQLLRESPNLTSQDRRLTDIITSNGERVSTIIENVLQLSRRDSTRAETVDLHVWLRTFLPEITDTLQLQPDSIRLSPTAEPVEVRVDPSHLHQLLWNLCENAVKYGRSAGSDEAIELHTGRIAPTNRPFLEVRDRGPGIPTTDTEKIFEPFFTAGEGGTGLGLFIARELAQCNGAILVYEPRAGGGSVFRLVFADPQRWQA